MRFIDPNTTHWVSRNALIDAYTSTYPVKGWLDLDSSAPLCDSLVKTLLSTPNPRYTLEIGAYKGRSTVLIAHMLKRYAPQAKLFSVDAFT